MVGGLSSQVENAAGISQIDHPVEGSASAESAAFGEQSFGISNVTSEPPQVPENFRVLEVAKNGDLVVGEGFWTVFCQEVENIFEAAQGHTVMQFNDGSSSSMSGVSPHTGYYNFLLRSTSGARRKKDVYPLPSQLLFLWQIYLDNVDPFIKILHAPTMTKTIREIRSSYESLGSSMQALVLAISLAAIMSLEDEVVKANFDTDREGLIAQYRLGTEQALEQADFLNHPDMTLLQALTIYLSVLQHTGETKIAWVLAGVLVRVAVAMKLHIDGSKHAHITIFEAEMRRRLWWQICFIDSRSEVWQVSAFKLSQDMFDTEIPTNTNDADIDPSMSRLPLPLREWTDISAFLVRCEIWKLSRQLQSITDFNQKREALERSEARINEKYLTQLDPNQPIHSYIGTSIRLFLSRLTLMLPPKPNYGNTIAQTEPAVPSSIFTSCLAAIEYTYRVRNEPSWSGWRWQIQGRKPPWNSLRSVLGHLSTGSWEPLYDRALASAKGSLEILPEVARSDPRYKQLLVLLSRAQERANEHHTQNCARLANVSADLLSPADLNISTTFEQTSINENISTAIPQESLLDMSDWSGAKMDWQAWNEIAGDLEIWDMGSL